MKSARRTLELLEAVAQHPDGVTFSALGDVLDIPQSSLYGLLQTVVAARWLVLDEETKRYFVGVKMWEAGQRFKRSREVTIRTRQYLLAAQRTLGETIQLGILDDLDIVYVDKVEGTRPLRLVSDVGGRLPAYVTAIGKVLLADLAEQRLLDRFAGATLEGYTEKTITSGDDLIEHLGTVRRKGYATDHGEYSPGVFCVGVPIRDATGRAVAAMSCSVSQTLIDLGEINEREIATALQQQATHASVALGAEPAAGTPG
ncbi:IclR family transcriptional regulator [Pseudactinotalea sp. Z1748]|uniref:IclR family transcriptional regulator n=1 Tax=Pseudactinotalea sp. Z1748 TaxID=3413027 RepID=UPI003C7C8851